MKMKITLNLFIAFASAVLLAGCTAGGDNQGLEYAPNMYHSVAYEPYTQITDPDAGRWATSIDYPSGHAEYYNSNNLNPFKMNLRLPPPNTVSRNQMPYRIPKDSLTQADQLVSPLDTTDVKALIADGKVLYEIYCDHCHGAKGEGDGPVADPTKYAGVANLKSDALKNITEGHIFHVITMGKGLMMPHGSQISPTERWKIAKYVKSIQN